LEGNRPTAGGLPCTFFAGYRQGRDLAGKAIRRRIRPPAPRSWRGWSQNPESVGECPHLSGARGVG
jgi:hypothetical protein